MTRRPITIPGTCTLPDAYLLMVNHKIRRLLVVDQGVLVGVVTLEDLRKNLPDAVISMEPMQEKFQVEKILAQDDVEVRRAPASGEGFVSGEERLGDAPQLAGPHARREAGQ